jgi:hypothetical protein
VPLRADGNYRGPRSLHVREHRKLGKHRTLTYASLPLINWLIDHTEVTKVDFGRVAGSFASSRFTPRIECKQNGNKLRLVLVSVNSAQSFEVSANSESVAAALALKLQVQWKEFQRAEDPGDM